MISKSIAEQIIDKAVKQAKELNYPFEVALADVYAGLLFEIDAYLYKTDLSESCNTKDFKDRFFEQVQSFYAQSRVFEVQNGHYR